MVLQARSRLVRLSSIRRGVGVSHTVPGNAERVRDLGQEAHIRLSVFDDPDTLAVQIDVRRARGGGINPGFGLALDEQPATGEQQLSAGLPDVVVELACLFSGKQAGGNSKGPDAAPRTGQPTNLMDLGLGEQIAAMGGDQFLAGEVPYETPQRPHGRRMKMGLRLLQRQDRRARRPRFQKRREQHQYRQALRALTVTVQGNPGTGDGPEV